MKLIVAKNITSSIITALESHGFDLVFTKENTNLLPGLTMHPDMQAAKVGNTLICDKALYGYYMDALSESGCTVVCGETKCRCNYPEDVAYNVKVMGDYVFHNFKHTDKKLLEYIEYKNKLDVNQGYSGCSICNVCENALITADTGIDRTAKKAGISSLLISPGHIALEGFDYGFIGGASFEYDGKVYFFGDVTCHPDYKKIKDFITLNNKEIVCLTKEYLTDYGSAIAFD